ncbi:hypothetical protein FSARC_12102 [Fusarium sarcochroum]|uniref:Cell wall galactomannoprotein n=1 Tax=Fusarium sarcochroum TaxID=1208366 RepID=A0A8H4TBC4_9HYPO|nr:hypothetical protein FSARC_12102 [Fusarium sarcochroum]
MKFLNLITFASLALATPLRRQQTVTGTIQGSVNTFSNGTLATTNQINDAVAAIKSNVGATVIVQLQGALRANYQAIAQALILATTNIARVTTEAAGGIAAQARGLTDQQIVQLTAALRTAIDSAENIGATVAITMTDLSPDARAAFQGEVDAVKDALNPFITPLVLFATAVRNASASGSAAITGLDPALTNLIRLQGELMASLGLPATTGS